MIWLRILAAALALSLIVIVSQRAEAWEGMTKEVMTSQGVCYPVENAEKTPLVPGSDTQIQTIGACTWGEIKALYYTEEDFRADFGEYPTYKRVKASLTEIAKILAIVPESMKRPQTIWVLYPPGAAPFSGKEIGGVTVTPGRAKVIIINGDLPDEDEQAL